MAPVDSRGYVFDAGPPSAAAFNPVNTKHLYNICTMLDQRLRRSADVIQILYNYK